MKYELSDLLAVQYNNTSLFSSLKEEAENNTPCYAYPIG